MNVFFALMITLGLCLAGLIPGMVHTAHTLPSNTIEQLKTEKEIYVSTKRKSGEWSTAAPIWFMYADGFIYFTTSPESYKTKRIKSGRNEVRISVGSKDGPTFTGTAVAFADAAIVERMGEAYNDRYWIAWFGLFRPRVDRVESGKTIAFKVTPDQKMASFAFTLCIYSLNSGVITSNN